MRTVFMDFEDLRIESEEYRELDADHVLVLTRYSGRGKVSGVPVSSTGTEVFEVHDGKLTTVVVSFDRDRAFADVGLER